MDAKERILKLLEEGKITADEAARLLEALKKSYGFSEVRIGCHLPSPPPPPDIPAVLCCAPRLHFRRFATHCC